MCFEVWLNNQSVPEIVLASGAWEFMSLNIPTVAAVDWTENSSGLVFDVFNHEFLSEVQRTKIVC